MYWYFEFCGRKIKLSRDGTESHEKMLDFEVWAMEQMPFRSRKEKSRILRRIRGGGIPIL